MLYAAILAITIVMLMMAINMNTIAKRIVYLEREHMHLAEGTGKAIKSIQESTDGVVQSAERVIASADEMTNAFRELVDKVSKQEDGDYRELIIEDNTQTIRPGDEVMVKAISDKPMVVIHQYTDDACVESPVKNIVLMDGDAVVVHEIKADDKDEWTRVIKTGRHFLHIEKMIKDMETEGNAISTGGRGYE